jgi:hypothetical protein
MNRVPKFTDRNDTVPFDITYSESALAPYSQKSMNLYTAFTCGLV